MYRDRSKVRPTIQIGRAHFSTLSVALLNSHIRFLSKCGNGSVKEPAMPHKEPFAIGTRCIVETVSAIVLIGHVQKENPSGHVF